MIYSAEIRFFDINFSSNTMISILLTVTILVFGCISCFWTRSPTLLLAASMGCGANVPFMVMDIQCNSWKKENEAFIQSFENASNGFSKETNEFLKLLSMSYPKKAREANIGLLLAFSENPGLVFTELSESGYFSIKGEKEEDIKGVNIKGFSLIYTQLWVKLKTDKAKPISLMFNPLVLSVSEKFPDLPEEQLLRVFESPLFFSLSQDIQDTLLQKSVKGQQVILKKFIQGEKDEQNST